MTMSKTITRRSSTMSLNADAWVRARYIIHDDAYLPMRVVRGSESDQPVR